ncbi:MAG: alpha/beta hydrolase [Eubacteriales bacterium]|nr:alpha/beta hydrolase [Eubacteriales bacterium]
MKNFTIESFDGTPLYCYLFDEVENPKGVVMVVHGMGEHMGRYKAFSEYLNKAGYLVFGDDHRGHGLSETDENRGHHDGDMFEDTVKDEVFFYDFLKKKYDLPVLMLGHSYGSFLGQAFLEQGTDVAGVALTGSGTMSRASTGLGMAASRFIMLFNPKTRMKILNPIARIRDCFVYRGKDDKGDKLWLTRDPVMRQVSRDDPHTSVPMSVSFCYYMLKGLRKAESKEEMKKLNPDTPIGLFSGTMDPIGGFEKSVTDLKNRYVDAGVKRVEFHLYEGARHEVLNETNRDEVMSDVVGFFDSCITKRTNYEKEG